MRTTPTPANQPENTQIAVQKQQAQHGGSWSKTCGCSSQSSSGDQSVWQKLGNSSDQKQIQIVPIGPQLNLQNVNLLTKGNVRQGDVNNANTGQANQQSGTQVAVQKSGRGWTKTCGCKWPTSSDEQSVMQKQGNWSRQEQLQIVPIAPQLNAQNVNLLTWGTVSQGNANTGQANQQENTQFAFQRRGWSIT